TCCAASRSISRKNRGHENTKSRSLRLSCLRVFVSSWIRSSLPAICNQSAICNLQSAICNCYDHPVPRNAEVIRQWTILREIEGARRSGVTIDELASLCDVTTRTIRRDLQALEEAGFPLFDDRSSADGKTRWRVNGQAFKGLAAGLTVSELCVLYFSRTLVESLSGTPFRDDVESAFDKLSSVLTPHMREFLDQLPRVIATKPDPLRRRVEDPRQQQIIARALEATLHLRQANITY